MIILLSKLILLAFVAVFLFVIVASLAFSDLRYRKGAR